jgi:integration host factor alpha subunit
LGGAATQPGYNFLAGGWPASGARRLKESKLTKADLIEAVANRAELSKRQANQVVETIFDEIETALQKGDRVALTPFGSFVVRDRKAREGRNPKTGEKITIAARKVPAFVAGKSLKEAVDSTKPGRR